MLGMEPGSVPGHPKQGKHPTAVLLLQPLTLKRMYSHSLCLIFGPLPSFPFCGSCSGTSWYPMAVSTVQAVFQGAFPNTPVPRMRKLFLTTQCHKPLTLGIGYKGSCGNKFCEQSKGGTTTKQDTQWGSQGNRPGSSSASGTIPTSPHPCCYFCCLLLYLLIAGRGHDPPIPYALCLLCATFDPKRQKKITRKGQEPGPVVTSDFYLLFMCCFVANFSLPPLPTLCVHVSMCPCVCDESLQASKLFIPIGALHWTHKIPGPYVPDPGRRTVASQANKMVTLHSLPLILTLLGQSYVFELSECNQCPLKRLGKSCSPTISDYLFCEQEEVG